MDNEEFEIQEDLESLEQELGEELTELDSDQEDFGELGEEMAEAGLEEFALENAGEAITVQSLFSEGDEGQVDAAFLNRIMKGRVKKLLEKLFRIARKMRRIRRCRRCIGLLTKTIRLYRRGRFVAALRYAWKTYRCFKRCAKRR